MTEDRGSTSEGFWIGLCVLLLLVTAGAGAFGFLQHRRAVEAEYMARIASAQQAEAHHEATDLVADLSVKVRDLEQRVGELENENHELRKQLEGAGE